MGDRLPEGAPGNPIQGFAPARTSATQFTGIPTQTTPPRAAKGDDLSARDRAVVGQHSCRLVGSAVDLDNGPRGQLQDAPHGELRLSKGDANGQIDVQQEREGAGTQRHMAGAGRLGPGAFSRPARQATSQPTNEPMKLAMTPRGWPRTSSQVFFASLAAFKTRVPACSQLVRGDPNHTVASGAT